MKIHKLLFTAKEIFKILKLGSLGFGFCGFIYPSTNYQKNVINF